MFNAVVKEMRIKQWTKNFLIYAALVFSGNLLNISKFINATEIFLSFCFLSSSIYFWNDIADIEKDKLNPRKKTRPIAAGIISINQGYLISVILFLLGSLITYIVNINCFLLGLSYILINIFYTMILKHIVIIDILVIAYGFVVRAVIGALAINTPMTMWFILCVLFLSLFLALGKRRHELWLLKSDYLSEARDVLKFYTLELIDQLMTIVTAVVLVCYALFSMDMHTEKQFTMLMTIPLVIYGMFYYLYLVRVKHSGGAPDEALYKEKPILFVVLIYILCIIGARNINIIDFMR